MVNFMAVLNSLNVISQLKINKTAANNMYIACFSKIINPKVSVYLQADFVSENPVGDYVARQHT